MNIVSGHQPVYLPWLGLFHKISLCDKFVYMDTVQYLNNDWNNRNKIKIATGELFLTVPIDKKKSRGNNINQIKIFNNFENPKDFWQRKHWESIKINYSKSPFFKSYFDEFEQMYVFMKWDKLVDICWYQFNLFLRILNIKDIDIIRMSEENFDGKKDELILNHSIKLNSSGIVFGEKGKDYVDISKFNKSKKKVYFQKYFHPTYKQRYGKFIPNLSVLDLIFNHGPESKNIILKENITKEELKNSNYWYN